MSKDTYFTQYNNRPNIVIVPIKSSCDDPPQKPGKEAEKEDNKTSTDVSNKSIPILIQGTTSNSESCTQKVTAKNKSWGSNYLQGIGLSNEKSILNTRGKMNTNEENSMFPKNQDPVPAAVAPHQFANVNLQTAAPNINSVYGQTSSILGNNTTYPNYNTPCTTGVMPGQPYPGSYENNNYYYGQRMNAVESGCCSACYSTVETRPNTYMNMYGQTSNIGTNTSSVSTYYDPNATSTVGSVTPYTPSYSCMNTNKTSTSITPCADNRCLTPLFDEITPQLNTYVNENSSVTKLTDVKSREEDTLSLVSNSAKAEKTCKCMCSKQDPDAHDKQNTKTDIDSDKKSDEMSSVQANKKAFRDFLHQIKLDCPSEKQKKKPSTIIKSPPSSKKVKKSKTKPKEKSSVQENEKAFRKLLQKLKMEHKALIAKSENKQIITKKTSSKVTTSSRCSENKSSKDPKEKEEERPKFIKTKYVDKQEPEYKPIKKARLDCNYELEKYSKTKIITKKYVDKQEPDYKPLKKSKLDIHNTKVYSTSNSKSSKHLDKQELACKPIKRSKNYSDCELKYSASKTIPTKYIDEQEPEYKPVKKARNASENELKKYSNTKTITTKYEEDKKHEYKQVKKSRVDSSSEFVKHSIPKFDSTRRPRDESETADLFRKKYDSDHKIRKFKTESTQYYKYRTEDCEEACKQSPVKSVIKISKTRQSKKSPLYNILDKEDLRDKLSRKLYTKNINCGEETMKRKSSEESNDNLIITVNNNISEDTWSPEKASDTPKTKPESCKKINLVINIVYKQPGSRSESDKSDGDSPKANADLSFLDDFNVDEIVASLNKSEKISTATQQCQQSQNETSTYVTTSSEEKAMNTDTSNVFIKRENLEISKAKMILDKGNVLHNLLSKEANILDNIRIIHQEIENGKSSCMDNEENKLYPENHTELPQKHNTCDANALISTDIKKETVFYQSNIGNACPKDAANATAKKISPLISTPRSPLTVLMEHLNKLDHIKDARETLNYDFDEEDKRGRSELLKILEDRKEDEVNVIQRITSKTPVYALNNVLNKTNNYDEDDISSFDEEDKRRQSELLKVLGDTEEDKLELIQTQNRTEPKTAYVSDKISSDMINYDDDITSFDEEDKIKQSDLLKVLDIVKDNKSDLTQTQTNKPQSPKVIVDVSNVINTYDVDITSFDEEDQRRQSELLKVLEDMKKNEVDVTRTQTDTKPQSTHNIDVSNVLTIIDLSSDDSNHSNKNKQSEESCLDDVYIVEDKNLIETIDLTRIENESHQIVTKSLDILNKKKDSPIALNKKKRKTNNKGISNVKILSNDIIRLADNEPKDAETLKASKIVNTQQSETDILNNVINTNKSNKNTIKEYPASSTMNKKLHGAKNGKEREKYDTLNNADVIPSDTQTSKESTPVRTKDESSASKTISKQCSQIKKDEQCKSELTVAIIANSDIEKEIHENEMDHIILKKESDMDTNLPMTEIDIKENSVADANNIEVEEPVTPQPDVGFNDKKSSTKDVKLDNSIIKASIEDCNTVQTSENLTICDKPKEKDIKNVKPQITESKPGVKIDDKKNTVEEGKSPNDKVQIKTEASNSKPAPASSGTKTNTPSPKIKKEKTNVKAVDVKVEHSKTKFVCQNRGVQKIGRRIEREMFECFNQNYKVQGIIHSGSFSKVFELTSFSGRQYAVKSYNAWSSIYKYAEQKDMLFTMQEGLLRNAHGCVFLVNSFSLQTHLCLLMDYYPKNLKQALEQNEKPFHIDMVQYLARQLVSAVMQLKSHDVVHLDIKPTHILLSHKNDRLKLCGFDIASYINKITVHPNLGTVNYRPPEVIVGYKIGFDVDVWATALVMYEMATGIMLFPGEQNNEVLFKQMCTLGALPAEMLQRALFSAAHFTGCSFKRTMPKGNKINIITKFYQTKRLESTIIKAYNDNWRPFVKEEETMAEKGKMLSFTALLRDMLEVDPGDRMPIQFVHAHPFISEEFC